MRNLTLLFVGLLLALIGQQIMRGTEVGESYMLRDGLLLCAAAALLYALFSSPIARLRPRISDLEWPLPGIVLWTTGVVSALAAGALFAQQTPSSFAAILRNVLWFQALLLMAAGVLWPFRQQIYDRPAYRWQLDAEGRFLRRPMDDDRADAVHTASFPSPRMLMFALLAVIMLGLFLRTWQLIALPPDCVDAECLQALQLQDGEMGGQIDLFNLYTRLSQFLFGLTGSSLVSLRLAAALIGIATIPAFFVLTREIIRVDSALLATALLALSPWHLWAGRTSQPWIVLPLFSCLAIWAVWRAYAAPTVRSWVLAGAGFGLLILSAPAVQGIYILLLLLAGAIFVLIYRPEAPARHLLLWMTTFFLTAVAVAVPAIVETVADGTLAAQLASMSGFQEITGALTLLLQPGQGATPAANLLWAALPGALAILGVGYLLRFIAVPRIALLSAAILLLVAGALRLDPALYRPAVALLPALIPIGMAAAIALDQLVRGIQEQWHRLLRPATVVTAALILMTFFGVRSLQPLVHALETAGFSTRDPVDAAMARYLSDRPQLTTGDSVVFVPASLFDNPTARVVAGPLLASAQLQPMGSVDTLLFPVDGESLRYLIPAADQARLDLLSLIYPAAEIEPYLDPDSGSHLFTIFSLSAQYLAQRRGLDGLYFAGILGDGELLARRADGPLAFDWAELSDHQGPFAVEWQGALLVPEAGAYTLSVEGAQAEDALFSLYLDNRIVLDSSLNLLESRQILAQGIYTVDMTYRSGSVPGPLTVRWQRPGAEPEPIPRTVLVNPAPPDVGLLGTYFSGAQFQGPALDLRKDLLPGIAADLPHPYSVIWRGKLAAARAGEYLLGTVADGVTQLSVDGHILVDSVAAESGAESDVAGYAEGVIYLDRGWHEIEVRFVPATSASELRLLWQPPGGFPLPLPPDYLLPREGEVLAADLPLPTPPALADSRLGNDGFALSQNIQMRRSGSVSGAGSLPPLPVVIRWQVDNGCGIADDQFEQPRGVAIDPQTKRVYVADSGNRRVVIYDPDGSRVGSVADDLFEEPFDIAANAGRLPVLLDAVTQQTYDIDPISGAATVRPQETGFYRPRGLDVDFSGNLYVADTGGARVAVLDPLGALLAEFGGQGTELGVGQPVDALATDAGRYWAITAEDGRLWDLTSGGSIAAVKPTNTLSGPHMADLPDGSFFLSDPGRGRIVYHLASGRPLLEVGYANLFAAPTGVGAAVDSDMISLAVMDSAACWLSLWQMSTMELYQAVEAATRP